MTSRPAAIISGVISISSCSSDSVIAFAMRPESRSCVMVRQPYTFPKRLAANLLGIGRSAVNEEESETTGEFRDARFSEGRDGGCRELVQFHPAYAYDD